MALKPSVALLLTVPPLMWAGNAVVGRLFAGHMPPVTLNVMRWAVAGVLLLPLAWRIFARPRELLARWRHLLLLGTLGVGSYNALQYLALLTSSPINVTLIAASMPVWMLAVGAVFYRERPRATQLAGAAISLAGVLLVLARGDPQALLRVHFVAGDLFVLVAVVCWAFYSWQLARPPADMRGAQAPQVDDGATRRGWNWAEALMAQIVFGLVVGVACSGVEVALSPAVPMLWNAWTLAGIAFIAIGPSILAYRTWGAGVALAGPAVAAFFSNLTPVFAAVLSAAVLGEAPQWFHGVAFAMIVAGIAVGQRR